MGRCSKKLSEVIIVELDKVNTTSSRKLKKELKDNGNSERDVVCGHLRKELYAARDSGGKNITEEISYLNTSDSDEIFLSNVQKYVMPKIK